MSRRQIADALKEASASYFLKKNYSCFVELGLTSWGKLRGDVLAVNLKGSIVLVECKSSKQDFVTDNKWGLYLPYCNKMYFAFTEEVYLANKLLISTKIKGTGIGILILSNDTGYLRVAKPAKLREMCEKIRFSLILRMAWRNGISKRNSRRKRQIIKDC